MAHDLENPRTKNYSKFKSFLISLELILKKGWLFIFVIINIFFHTKKNNYIDIGNYKNKDSRFINFLFQSLKSKYNFSYSISLSILDFVKKIGIKNFVLNSTPNIFVKNSNKFKFKLNDQNHNQDELNFNTNYFHDYKDKKLFFLLSIFVHVVFVYQIQKINKVDEIYVLDLSTYKEFKPKKVEVKKQVIKDVPKPEKKIIQK